MQDELNQFFSEKKHLYNPYSKLQEIKLVNIALASSEQIKKWAEKKLPNGKVLGQVTNANTLHHKTFKPLKGGLFCERIFGPVKDFQCSCGKTKKFTSSILAQFKEEKIYKNDFQENYSNEEQERERIFCPICDVEYTWSVIRRYQLGYIQLVAPVTHLWYLKGSPSYLSLLLDMKKKKIESVVYCSENMTLETINSIVFSKQFLKEGPFSFVFEKRKEKNSESSAPQKPTSSLYNSWEKMVKSIEAKQSFNNIDSINSLPKNNISKKELVFSKITSYLFFLKKKAKKERIQRSLNGKTQTMKKTLKPKRLSGWRNLKIQTLNSLFENFSYLKHRKTSNSLPIAIFLKLKNLKQIDDTFIHFLTNLKNHKVFYKIAHKKAHQIILKIQIEFFKKIIKEILDNNFSNVNSTLKPLLNENNNKLALSSFFQKKEKGMFDFEEMKKERKIFNNKLIFNNFDKTSKPENKDQGNFLLNQNNIKENKDGIFFGLNRKNSEISKNDPLTRQLLGVSSFSSEGKKDKQLKKIKIIKSILIFRIKKEIFNSEINKNPFSHFSCFLEKDSFLLSQKNTQVSVNFFNIKKGVSSNKKTNLNFFNLGIYENNFKNLTISNHTTLNLKEKNKILFLCAFFIFNFFFTKSKVFFSKIKKKDNQTPKGALFNETPHKQPWLFEGVLFYPGSFVLPLRKKKIKNKIKGKENRKQFIEKNLKIIRINTLNSIIETLGLREIKNYHEEYKPKSFFLKKKNVLKREESLENKKIKKKNGSNNKKVETFSERKEKSSFSEKSKKSGHKQNYSLYCISHRFCWENEKDWSNFVYFFSAPTKMDDIPISTYIDRIPSTFHRPFSGAKVLQKLLTEFHFQEFKKMDRQNRILLYELNKQIQKDFSESQLKSKNSYLSTFFSEENKKERKEKSLNLEKRQKRKFAQKRDQLIRRTKFIRKLFRKNSQPESMILSFLPVLPPDLRPILKIQDQIAASDLNRLYQRVLYRNERLKKFLKDSAMSYSYEMKYAQRLLQEAIDNLLQNGKAGGTPERDSRGRLLKSLSEILKGKQGRFRQHLLGKRVDYSGRSVIVVGPQLKIHECGLPKEMALELFLPFLLKRLIHLKIARTVIGAKTILKNHPNFAWEILYEVMQNYPVLLNRAPTLHRLGIQAFQPKLVEGRAILLHPLVCPAFNADFDGDQMAVHIPLTVEARSEAWKLMCSGNHFFSPATGDPLLLPSQDMVLGCYYLTTEKQIRHKNLFQSKQEQITENLFGLEKKDIHNIIWVKWDGSLESLDDPEDPLEMRINSFGDWNEIFSKSQYHFDLNGLLMSQFIRTTNGRLFFNEMLSSFSK